MADDSIVSAENTERFLVEIVKNSDGGMAEDEMLDAYEHLCDMVTTSALVRLWYDRRIELKWNRETREFGIITKR
jgi:hypothetical protein